MTINAVQGVQGVQGTFLPTLHSAKPRAARACVVLCRVCRVFPSRVCARNVCRHSILKLRSRAYIHTLHTLHTLHRPRMTWPTAVQGIFFRAREPYTPCTLKKIIRIMSNKIVCGPENIREFNARLRTELPAFHALAKRLHQAGLISGLAGATIECLDDDDNAEQIAQQHPTTQHTCGTCSHFHLDTVGDGSGIGTCNVGGWPHRLKYPGREACRKFESAQ